MKFFKTIVANAVLFFGVETFWTVLDNELMINRIKNWNKLGKEEFAVTFDFSILFTNMSHRKLLKVLNELTDYCFDRESHKYISVNKFGARWISKQDSYSVVFHKCSFLRYKVCFG